MTRRVLLAWEARAQLRDPLTTLYAIVFFLLAFGFTSSGVVELVRERGTAPRASAWALMLAFGGVTAFAQVISTMIAVSAVLRDQATRTIALVATSGVHPRDWFLGRVGAALLVALLVYAAIPLGALSGALVAGEGSPGLPWRVMRPFLLLTVPTMLAVTALVCCAAARTRRVVPALAMALLLVACWQGGLTLEASASSAGWRTAGALLDPFANAPVLRATRGWSESRRASQVPPADAALLLNRALWLLVATIAVADTRRRIGFHPPAPAAPAAPAQAERATGGATLRRPREAAPHAGATAAVRRLTSAWISRDGGWRVIGALLLLNAALNGILRGDGGSPAAVLALVAEGSRVFLIVLATVYAGELLWRERELRVAPLVDALPVRTGALAYGAMLGLARSQLGVVAALAAAGALAVAFGARWTGATEAIALLGAWTVFVVWLPFAQLTALSLLVHALVRHKVLAHLLLITGWTLAVILDGALDRAGMSAWWLRFARPAMLLGEDGAIAWGALAARAGYWSAVSGALVVLTALRWPRGQSRRRGYAPITSRR